MVQAHRTSSNLVEPHHYRDRKVCRVLHLFWVVHVHRTSSNLLEPHHYRDSKVCRGLSHEFGVVRLYRTFSIYIVYRGNKVCRVLMHLFGVVKAHQTYSNLPELHHYRDRNVCRVLSHEFGVVRLFRTFSIYIVTGETRCEGCLCTCSGWFKNIEPPRTFSNHIITEIARCVEFCHMSSGWFDCTEPSLSTSLQGKQGVKGAYALIRGGSSTSNLLEPHHCSGRKVFRVLSHEFGVVRQYRTFSIYIVTGETRRAGCLCSSSGWFKHIEPRRTLSNHIITEIERFVEFCTCSGLFTCIEPPRTFSNHIITEIARCLEFCYRDSKVCRVLSHEFSGWFDCTEPSLSTSLQVQQGMQGVVHLFGVHRISSNLLEPHHYKDSKVCSILSHEFGVVRLYRTFSIYIVKVETGSSGCLWTSIEPSRTTSLQ